MAASKESLNKELIETLFDGTKVYLVDGEYVRNNNGEEGVTFVYGGHGYVYKWIPKDEIWIERTLKPEEQRFWVVHEIFEWVFMKYEKESYEKAHEHANSVEHCVRLVATTKKLRKLADSNAQTQLMLEPITDADKPETPVKKKPNTQPMPSLDQLYRIKKYTGNEAQHYINWLNDHNSKQQIRWFMDLVIEKYEPDFDYTASKPVPFKPQGKNGFRYHEYILTWTKDLKPGVVPEVELYIIPYNKQNFLEAGIVPLAWHRRLHARLALKKYARKEGTPAKVTEIADAIRRDDESKSDAVAYKIAWEQYCSYINPSYDGCTSKGKSHRQSPKSEYTDD